MMWLNPLIKGEMMDCHFQLEALLKNKTFHFTKKAKIVKDGVVVKPINKRENDELPSLAGCIFPKR